MLGFKNCLFTLFINDHSIFGMSSRFKIPRFVTILTLTVALFVSLAVLFLPGKSELSIEEGDAERTSLMREFDEEDLLLSVSTILGSLESSGPISSVLVSQHEELIAVHYFGTMHAGRGHNIKSASKSVLSILVGIAIDKGYLEGVDQPMGEFFPEYFDGNTQPEKAAITIEDLLTMRSGLASTSRANYGRWVTSNNWIRYALDRPLQGTPGRDRIYSTGNTHLLAVILHRATGMNTLQFANRYLFSPMDIRVTGWDRDPQGYYLGGNNMAMRPADMIKIGQLMMDVGKYNGEQLVSKEWIMRSVEPVTGRMGQNNYGYLWFRRMAGEYHVVYAFGSGGQYIMILPELDAVISVTTRNETSGPTRNYRRELFSTLDREIIPLLETRARVNGFL
jgi:CubicO group peptidase (beta-lactamase class C family)